MNDKWLICVRLFAAGLPACALSGGQYLKATSQVGGIVSMTAANMPDDMSIGTAVCHRRAELDYVQHRVELPHVAIFEWSTGAEWGAFYGAQSVDGTSADTWEAQCKVFENADALFEKAMKILGEYGAALTRLADSGAYDGKDVQGDLKSAGDLATVLGASNAVGKDLSSVGPPLAQIAHLLVQKIVAEEAKHFVFTIQPSVSTVLFGLVKYLDAIQMELRDEKSRVKLLVSTVRSRVAIDTDAGDRPDRSATLAYGYVTHELAVHAERSDAMTKKLEAVLCDLLEAHAALAKEDHLDLNGLGHALTSWKTDLFRVGWREWQ